MCITQCKFACLFTSLQLLAQLPRYVGVYMIHMILWGSVTPENSSAQCLQYDFMLLGLCMHLP